MKRWGILFPIKVMDRAQHRERPWHSHRRSQEETVCWHQEVLRMPGHSDAHTGSPLPWSRLKIADPLSTQLLGPDGDILKECLPMHMKCMQHYPQHHCWYWQTFRVCGEQRQRGLGETEILKTYNSIWRHFYKQVLDISENGADQKNSSFWPRPRKTAQVQMWRFK